jgi:predicted dehydrogenase
VAVFEYPKALAIIANSTHQPNAFAHRSFEVFGTNGTISLKPIEPPTLELDLAKPAGPYKSGRQQIPLPKYSRYVGDLADFAQALRGGKLAASLDDELLVHEWVLKSSNMWDE